MEEKELLRILSILAVLLLFSLINIWNCIAASKEIIFSKEDIKWAENLRKEALHMTHKNILAKYKELIMQTKGQAQIMKREIIEKKVMEGEGEKKREKFQRGESGLARLEKENKDKIDPWIESSINPRPNLRIFVSSSMSLSLLQAYHKQASIYGGTLVFKGLPQGSFKELIKLVSSIADGEEIGSMQIDDEAFEKFNITAVPTIILSQESDCIFHEKCKTTFDVIEGSIAIRLALENFAKSGDMQLEAQEILEQ